MIEANKYKLGLFVISGIALLVLVLFLLGIAEAFKPKVQFVTLFDESVQGLEPGAAVKFRGVTIGKVSSVTVRNSDNMVRVDMEADLSAIDTGNQEKLSVITRKAEFFYRMEKEVGKGLRCRLDLAGITGLKYVELNYLDPVKCPVPDIVPPKGVRYIPSTPSFLRGLSANITTALARIANIDFDEISKEFLGSLKSLRVQIEDAKLADTSESARNTLDEARKAVKTFNELSAEVSETLRKVDSALDSVSELVSNMDEDPSSIIRGKQKKPLEF